MNHTNRHIPDDRPSIHGRPRTHVLGAILALGLGVPLGTAASEDKERRKPILPHVASSDIDNEGPVTRQPGMPRLTFDHHRRQAVLHWNSPIRLDLILPIRTMQHRTMPWIPPGRR